MTTILSQVPKDSIVESTYEVAPPKSNWLIDLIYNPSLHAISGRCSYILMDSIKRYLLACSFTLPIARSCSVYNVFIRFLSFGGTKLTATS